MFQKCCDMWLGGLWRACVLAYVGLLLLRELTEGSWQRSEITEKDTQEMGEESLVCVYYQP